MPSEKKANQCLLHANVFSIAKQFKKLCLSDQKILFQFVDNFFPPNHALYFLMREILQTSNKTANQATIDDGIDDKEPHPSQPGMNNNLTIRSVRDYSGYASAMTHRSALNHDSQKYRTKDTLSWYSSSSDCLSDTTQQSLQKNKKKIKRTMPRHKPNHKEDNVLNNKKRNIYRLLNSTSANAVERHYDRALQEESIYWYQCESETVNQHDNPPCLLILHRCFGIHCNNIAGNTLHTAEQWHFRSDARLKPNVQYTIRYPEKRDESTELSIHPPNDYNIELQLLANVHPADALTPSIRYLHDTVKTRAALVTRFIRHHERNLDDIPYPVHRPKAKSVHQPSMLQDEPSDRDKRQNQCEYDANRDHRYQSPSPPQDAVNERAANTTARRFGVMNLLPKDIRKKHLHLYSFNELSHVTQYVINTASMRITKLIDFALLSAPDTWALLNRIMDHALDIYLDCHRYPVQDSLTSILLYDTENSEKVTGCESECALNIDRYALIWQNGESAKLGDIITFVQTYRRLMRTVLSTCCCYFMERRAINTRSFIEKHPCLLPKATQGIYFSMFLRIRAGHELLCLSRINDIHDAYSWLHKFDRLRETMWRKRQIPYTDKLRDHLTLVTPAPGHNNANCLIDSSSSDTGYNTIYAKKTAITLKPARRPVHHYSSDDTDY